MEISKDLFEILKYEEGYSSKPYLCPAGVWTIGYGSTVYEDGTRVKQTDPEIDEIRAEEICKYHFNKNVYPVIDRLVKIQLNQSQFDALCSFVYNVGAGNFANSTLLKKLNANDILGAADEFLKWNMGGGKVLEGLVRRRKKERALFLKC